MGETVVVPNVGGAPKAQSHGCIRLTNWDAAEVAGLVRVGTPVELRATRW